MYRNFTRVICITTNPCHKGDSIMSFTFDLYCIVLYNLRAVGWVRAAEVSLSVVPFGLVRHLF